MKTIVGNINKKYLTLSQVADLLGYSHEYAQRIWPQWNKFGVQAFRPGRKLLFKAEEIDQMIEASAIN